MTSDSEVTSVTSPSTSVRKSRPDWSSPEENPEWFPHMLKRLALGWRARLRSLYSQRQHCSPAEFERLREYYETSLGRVEALLLEAKKLP